MKPRVWRGYAVVAEDGCLYCHLSFKKQMIYEMHAGTLGTTWRKCHEAGDRVVKVEVRELKKGRKANG